MSIRTRSWIAEEAALRLNVAGLIADWCNVDEPRSYEILRQMCGKRFDGVFDNFTEEDKYKCELLLGPHGYTFFKMLCIKMGLTELCINPTDS